MIATFVHVWVQEDRIEAFINATIENHEKSIHEPGNLRFDVLQDASDPSRFVLYEAYISESGAAAHKNTPHYMAWLDIVAPWMVKPRQGINYKVIKPAGK